LRRWRGREAAPRVPSKIDREAQTSFLLAILILILIQSGIDQEQEQEEWRRRR
jgi:hypothetical protein